MNEENELTENGTEGGGGRTGVIVVGVDGSEHSLAALRWAAEEARLRGCTLRVVAAFTTPLMTTGYEMMAPDPTDLHNATDSLLDAVVASVRAEGLLEHLEVEAEVLDGHAAERLIVCSEAADLLVVGSRGHGGFVGVLLGSVTTYCVNHAKCPVVVVRSRS